MANRKPKVKNPDDRKLRKDAAETAWAVVQAAIGEGPRPMPPGAREKSPEAMRRGRKGGKKGGKARSVAMTPAERQQAARNAANARWHHAEGTD